jgi:hypothetical protein
MASTRTPGITVNPAGERTIDKEHRGVRIYARLGPVGEGEAKQRLAAEMERVEVDLLQKAVGPRFADAAARYLEESRDLRSADVAAWHIRLLTSYVGTLALNRIHDRTLERFIADWLEDGVTATTINRSLEIVRTGLSRAARSYRDDERCPWLEAENRMLRERLGERRIVFTDAERRQLAEKAKALGRKALHELGTIVTPETLFRWHGELIARKWTFVEKRSPGRPRIGGKVVALVVRMARENRGWGYTRIQGAMANLGYTLGRSTIGRILKDHGIEPAIATGVPRFWKKSIHNSNAVADASRVTTYVGG